MIKKTNQTKMNITSYELWFDSLPNYRESTGKIVHVQTISNSTFLIPFSEAFGLLTQDRVLG